MQANAKASVLKRLRRIEGQVRGLARMVEDDRYCIDIVTQLTAARAALRRAEEAILADHVAHCVEHAISSGHKGEQRRKVGELIDVLFSQRSVKERPPALSRTFFAPAPRPALAPRVF
jgi:CsoR family transcriptional regulator, copper-sensing transcriptional repressor